MDFDPRDFKDARDIDHQSIYGFSRTEDERRRYQPEERDPDPRDPFVRSAGLPCGSERELVQDSRERRYELNGDDSRMLATIGAFRVVSERDLDAFRGVEDSLERLREEELIRTVPIGDNEEAVVLTD